MLDADACYRALESRDRRFEGQFIIAVKTTGVYCRPGCPARVPKRVNVVFFAHAAAAESAGFRACLRCRPDASPTCPAVIGTPTTVSRALRMIEEGELGEGGVEALASRLGVGGRHLRRLFDKHLGASPIVIAQSRRVHFARKLLEETGLSMTEIAHASGFASVRRFNDAVRTAFKMAPRELRARSKKQTKDKVRLTLPYRPPLAWDELVAFLAGRAIPGVEHVEGGVYARTFEGGVLKVSLAGDRKVLLEIEADGRVDLFALAGKVRRLFDLDADPAVIEAHLGKLAKIKGLRVPGAWDGFEMAVRAILGQQVTVKGASTLAGRLVARYGEAIDGASGPLTHRFPSASKLAGADLEKIGLPGARAESIRALARAVVAKQIDLDGAAGLEATVASLQTIRGVGAWTAHYLAMRAGREPDAFPAGDLVLRKHASKNGDVIAERELERRSEAWRPWRAYAAMQLWHSKPKERKS